MIKYCCDKCGEEIKKYDGDNDRMVLNYYIEKNDGYQGWYRIILCDECSNKLTEWLKEK